MTTSYSVLWTYKQINGTQSFKVPFIVTKKNRMKTYLIYLF